MRVARGIARALAFIFSSNKNRPLGSRLFVWLLWSVVVRSCLALKLLALFVVSCSAAEMDLASASRLPTTSPSISASANESVLVLNRTARSLPRTGDPIWSLRLETPGQPLQHFDAVSGRAHRQNAARHRSGTRAPLPSVATALARLSLCVTLIYGS